jgi:hypothetical protein
MILIRKDTLIVTTELIHPLVVCNISQCAANQIQFIVGVIHANKK